MILGILIFVFFVVGLFGLYMVNKVGNYESVWGVFLFGGFFIFIVLLIAAVILFFLGML